MPPLKYRLARYKRLSNIVHFLISYERVVLRYVGSHNVFHKCLSQYYATVHRGGAESAEEAQRKYQKAFLLFLSAESPRSPRLYGE